MPRGRTKNSTTRNGDGASPLGFEAKVWAAADALRNNMDAAEYADAPGFCKRATLDDIRKLGHVLTPGRYVGAKAAEDDGEPIENKVKRLTATRRKQQAEAAKLDAAIAANLKELGFWSGAR